MREKLGVEKGKRWLLCGDVTITRLLLYVPFLYECDYGRANGQRLDNQILGVFEDIVRQLRQTTFGRREDRQKKKSRKCIVL